MKKMTKVMSMILLGSSLVAFSGCGKKAKADNNKVKIGILQLLDQTALNEAKEGFEEGLAQSGFPKDKVVFQKTKWKLTF